MNFTFTFEGIVETECNRCLDSIKIPVSGKESIVIKITEEPKESDGEIFYIALMKYHLMYMIKFMSLFVLAFR